MTELLLVEPFPLTRMFSGAGCTVNIYTLELDETTTDGGVESGHDHHDQDVLRGPGQDRREQRQERPGKCPDSDRLLGRLPREEQQARPGHHSDPYGEHEASDGRQRGAYEQDLRDPRGAGRSPQALLRAVGRSVR